MDIDNNNLDDLLEWFSDPANKHKINAAILGKAKAARLQEIDDAGISLIMLTQPTISTWGHQIKTDAAGWTQLLANMPDASYAQLLQALKQGRHTIDTPVPVDSDYCYNCGQSIQLETDGQILQPNTDCDYPDGVAVEFTLEVPSGAIVAADHLYPEFVDGGQHDVISLYGQARKSFAMAEIGCAFGYVGNNSPDLYRVTDDQYQLANPAVDKNHVKLPFPGTSLGKIVTSNDSYAIADAGLYDRRRNTTDPTIHGDWQPQRISVKPGLYRFRHHAYKRGFHDDTKLTPVIYAEFEWIGPL